MVRKKKEELFILEWRDFARRLNLEIVENFQLVGANGVPQIIPILLRNFGSKNGMLLVLDYSSIERLPKKLFDSEYGYSVLDIPNPATSGDRELPIEMLCDWGWTGPSSKKPTWIQE